MNLEIPFIPPSLNSMYRVFRGRSILSESARDFKKNMKLLVSSAMKEYMDIEHDYYEVEITISTPSLYRKDGKINQKSGDVDNMCKALVDVIFTECKQNDSKITRLIVSKRHKESESTMVNIEGFFL